MPFKSRAQQRFMYSASADGRLPKEMAERWSKHTKDFKALPEHVSDSPEKKGFSHMDAIATFAKQAADNQAAEKLARDTQITPQMVHDMARAVNMSAAKFTKLAYDDPQGYTIFLNLLSGRVKAANLTKGAAASKLVESLLGAMRKVGQAGKAAVGAQNTLTPGSMFGSSSGAGSVGQTMNKLSPLGGSQAGRIATGVGAGGAAGGVGLGVAGGKPAGPTEQAAAIGSAAATAPKPQAAPMPGAGGGATPSPEQSTNPQGAGGSGGLSTGAKVGIGAGLGLGAGALIRKKKQKQVQASDSVAEHAKAVMRGLIEKKAAEKHRNDFCTFLDTVVKHMPLEKSAAVRTIQSEVAKGKPIAQAIKVAYPHMNGDARGILASDLVRRAVSYTKKANFGEQKVKTTEKKTWTGKASQGGFKMKEMTS